MLSALHAIDEDLKELHHGYVEVLPGLTSLWDLSGIEDIKVAECD